MKKTVLVMTVLATACAGLVIYEASTADAVEQAQTLSLMDKKLVQAKILLEALVLEDYERIGTSSARLREISLQAQWVQPHSQRFGVYGDEFRTTLDRMGNNALEKNLDGVTLNFMHMVATCVECHEVVREGEGIAGLPVPLSKSLDTVATRNIQ